MLRGRKRPDSIGHEHPVAVWNRAASGTVMLAKQSLVIDLTSKGWWITIETKGPKQRAQSVFDKLRIALPKQQGFKPSVKKAH